jgi:CubicO group peptidase (beta-lactamase class C family)
MGADPCKTVRDQIAAVQAELADLGPEPGRAGVGERHRRQELQVQLGQLEQQLRHCECKEDVVATGTAVSALSSLEDEIRAWMCSNGIQALQVAVAHGGEELYSRAFSNDGGTVEPTSLFRIASCSKAFTCAAITNLYDRTKVSSTDGVFSLLGLSAGGDLATITVDDLVKHAGGWVDRGGTFTDPHGNTITGSGFDPVFAIRTIGAPLSNPPTKRDIAQYMLSQSLQFKPGADDETWRDSNGGLITYSNFGYLLLGLVVEEVSGQPYIDYVRDLLGSEGTSDVHVARMLGGALNGREMTYLDSGAWAPSALEPHASVNAPLPYGGAGFVTELMDSGGGLMTTASNLARFSSNHATWGTGGRAPGNAREGWMSGTTAWMESRDANALDFAWITNQALSPSSVVDDLAGKMRAAVDSAASSLTGIHVSPTLPRPPGPPLFIGRPPRPA